MAIEQTTNAIITDKIDIFSLITHYAIELWTWNQEKKIAQFKRLKLD